MGCENMADDEPLRVRIGKIARNVMKKPTPLLDVMDKVELTHGRELWLTK